MEARGNFSKIILMASLILVLVFSTGCTKGGSSEAKAAYKQTKLVYWRVWDGADDMDPLFAAYKKIRPNVSIEYRKLRFEEYENALVEALAEDRGPDVFSVHNTWMPRYQSKLLPLPAKTVIPVKSLQGSIKKEEVVELKTNTSLTALDVERTYLDQVYDDAVMVQVTGSGDAVKRANKVYGLPLSMDTLVLYYNKDILNNAGIVEPAKTWVEFRDQVKAITKIDEKTGEILLAGAALGTADNVERNFDILSLLMMQNLAPMITEEGAAFNTKPKGLAVEVAPGLGALEFYTQFASPLYEGYTWNDKMPNSLDAFIKGKTAYFFGYSYHRETIGAKAPKLNYDIAPVPQVGTDQKVNYANYWLEVVSEKTKVKDYAWDFVQFITKEQNVEAYLNKVKKPTALKSKALINKQLADKSLTAFADQLLTARSWYKGLNPNGAEKVFDEMINNVLTGTLTSGKALSDAVDKVNITMRVK